MASAAARGRRRGEILRVGLFGRCGSGNIGNDASMEAVVNFLRAEHPGAYVDAMCTRPKAVQALCGIEAVPLQWHLRNGKRGSSGGEALRKAVGLAFDVVRTARWAARHDVLIVPGAGVLETSLPVLRSFPWAMLVMCAAGRLAGAKIALVSVGAGTVKQPLTRWLYDSVVRLSTYRSYRDAGAREALARRGHHVEDDRVYPDLAFALPTLTTGPGDLRTVGVGLMDYRGSADDRLRGGEIHAAYLGQMKRFVRWLVDEGRDVRLFIGDTNGSDDGVVREILADLRVTRPWLEPSRVIPQPVVSFSDLMRAMAPVGSVVAIRYHNVLCALKLCKPTIAIGYSPKHHALMADMGVPELCRDVASLDAQELAEELTKLEARSAEVRHALSERNADKDRRLVGMFAELDAVLRQAVPRPGDIPVRAPTYRVVP